VIEMIAGMIVEAGENETVIVETIVEAAAAMGASILTLKTKVWHQLRVGAELCLRC